MGRVLAAAGLFLLLAGAACADGAVFGKGPSSKLTPGRTGDQRGLVIFDSGRETLIVQTVVEGATGELAWVVPTPSLVKARDACETDHLLFEELDRTTAPMFEPVRSWSLGYARKAETAGAAGGRVTVHEMVTVGSHEITTLTSDAPNALVRWLTEHGYAVPPNARPVIAGYVRRGWAFTAVRVARPEGSTPEFRLPPLALPFATKEPVFPLAISGISPVDGEAEVLLYCIAPHRVEVANYPTTLMNIADLGWFADPSLAYEDRLAAIAHCEERPTFVVEYCMAAPGPSRLSPGSPATAAKLPGLNYRSGLVLTRLRTWFGPGQYAEDAVLRRSEEQWQFRTEIQQVGIPTEAALLLLLGVGAWATGTKLARRGDTKLTPALGCGFVFAAFVVVGSCMPVAFLVMLLGGDRQRAVSGFSLVGIGVGVALGCAAYLVARRYGERQPARWLGIAVAVVGSVIALVIGQTV